MAERVGYVRVSRAVQNQELQRDALNKYGVSRVFEDTMTRVNFDRVGLNACLDYMRAGDTLVVWKLDRLGGNLMELIRLMQELKGRSIEFVSLTEGINTNTPVGKLFFHITGAFAEYERELIRERVMAGVQSARERGRKGGRPNAMSKTRAAMAREMMKNRKDGVTSQSIADELGVSRATLYKYTRQEANGES